MLSIWRVRKHLGRRCSTPLCVPRLSSHENGTRYAICELQLFARCPVCRGNYLFTTADCSNRNTESELNATDFLTDFPPGYAFKIVIPLLNCFLSILYRTDDDHVEGTNNNVRLKQQNLVNRNMSRCEWSFYPGLPPPPPANRRRTSKRTPRRKIIVRSGACCWCW